MWSFWRTFLYSQRCTYYMSKCEAKFFPERISFGLSHFISFLAAERCPHFPAVRDAIRKAKFKANSYAERGTVRWTFFSAIL